MVIVGVPGINGLGHTDGCEKAPSLVLEGIEHEMIELNNSDVEEQERAIYGKAKFFLKKGAFFVGGDHSISYPIVRGFMDNGRNTKCLIVFDAHADMMPPMKEPTHEEWLRAAVESGMSGRNVLLIGARVVEPEEEDYMKEKRINHVECSDACSVNEIIRVIKEVAYGKEIYVSVDLDVLDNEEFNSTGYSVRGGMQVEELEDILDFILRMNVVGGDLVEYNPTKGNKKQGLEVAQRILSKFIRRFGR